MLSNLSATFQEKWGTFKDSLNDQVWFQELKEKWEGLDPEMRLAVKMGSLALAVIALLLWVLSFIWGVHKLSAEVNEKTDLIAYLQASSDEMRRLRESNSSASSSGAEDSSPWSSYFQSLASQVLIDPSNLSVSGEKPGAKTDTTAEGLIDISLKHVSIKQIVRFLNMVETSARPVKVRNLLIDAKNDPSGYLDAEIAVSGFSLTTK